MKNLADQKMVTQKELHTLSALFNNTQKQIKDLAGMVESEKDLQNKNDMSVEIKNHKKYIRLLRFRRVTIVIIATNRLLQVINKKEGNEMSRGKYKASSSNKLIKQYVYNDIKSLMHYVDIDLNIKLKGKSLNYNRDWDPTEVLVKNLEQLYNEPLNAKKDRWNSMCDFLRRGLREIMSKYSWLHLNVPSELLTLNIEYIDTLFYKDLMLQENIKAINHSLNQVSELQSKLQTYGDELNNQLVKVKEQEDIIRALRVKESNSIPIEEYKQELNVKNQCIKSLTKELVM